MNVLRILSVFLLLACCWQCRQATMPAPEPGNPQPAVGTPIDPGSTLRKPEIGSAFKPDSAIPILPRPFPQLMGGGSQTETLRGTVLSAAGAPLPGIRVKVLPSGYDPSRTDSAVLRVAFTDTLGRFAVDGLDSSGYYNVIAGSPEERQWAFAESLQTRPVHPPLSLGPASTFLISMHRDAYATSDSGLAYFPGTDVLARCYGFKSTRVDSIPFGMERLILRSQAGWQHQVQVPAEADTVQIDAGRTGVSILYRPK